MYKKDKYNAATVVYLYVENASSYFTTL
jgi:hypothetical protein